MGERVRVPTYAAVQVRAAEAPLLAAGAPLMARASAALARVAADALAPGPARILVLAGSGDNGGDALLAAAILARREGTRVDVLLVSERAHAGGLAAALAAGARRTALAEAVAADHDLVLDGILGIGASADAALRGPARAAVEALLPGRPRTIAVDLPSGLNPDTGAADDAVLPAIATVTFGAVKHGLVAGRGSELTGELVLVDLGLGPGLAGATPAGEAEVVLAQPAETT